MKNLAKVGLFLGAITALFVLKTQDAQAAYPPMREGSFTSIGTGTTVSVSTSAWTALPTTSSLTGRQTISVSNASANSTFMVLMISASSSSPSQAITVHDIYLAPGSTVFLGVPPGLYLYGVYTGAAAANVHVKEYIQ